MSVHGQFRGLFMLLPFHGTFLSLSAMKHTFVHNSLTLNPTCYFGPKGHDHVGPLVVPWLFMFFPSSHSLLSLRVAKRTFVYNSL